MLFGVSRFLNQESMDQSVSQSVRGTKINFKVPDLLSQFFIPDQVIKIVEVELQQELHLLGGFQHQEGWVKIWKCDWQVREDNPSATTQNVFPQDESSRDGFPIQRFVSTNFGLGLGAKMFSQKGCMCYTFACIWLLLMLFCLHLFVSSYKLLLFMSASTAFDCCDCLFVAWVMCIVWAHLWAHEAPCVALIMQ